MPDFTVRSDSVNVEQIMEQIRERIREKRGADYTEQEIRELAAVKLEKFLDPKGVRSDLLEAYRRAHAASVPPAPPNYVFGEETLFETHRGPLRAIRRLLAPIQKLFWNPNPLIQALHIQSQVNTVNAQRETERRGLNQLHFEVLHNLVLETTKMSIEIKNLKMKVESLTGRLEFNERRARALESVVVYRPSTPEREAAPEAPQPPSAGAGQPVPPAAAAAASPGQAAPAAAGEGPGQRSRRRRRRRGRRGCAPAAVVMGGAQQTAAVQNGETAVEAADGDEGPEDTFEPAEKQEAPSASEGSTGPMRNEPTPGSDSSEPQ